MASPFTEAGVKLPVKTFNVLIDVEFLCYNIKIIPIIFSLFGCYISLILNMNYSN